MKFGDPRFLILVGLLIPALAVFYYFSGRSRLKRMEGFAGKDLIGRTTVFYNVRTRRVRIALTIAALACMLISLARPQWGFSWKENKRKGIDIVMGIDTSKSMLCRDMLPDRLEFVKKEVAAFAKRLSGDRMGLIAFSGSAFLQCPLTADYKGFLLAVNGLGTGAVSRGGTAISSAIREAVRCYRGAESPHRIFVLVSDGEHHEGDIDKAIALANEAKIRIFCIGVGTPEGAVVYDTDESGKRTAMKDSDGKPAVSRLNEQVLMKIARSTGGRYHRATEASFGLAAFYDEDLSKLEKRESEGDKVKVYRDRFQYTVAIACLLLVAEMIMREKGAGEER